MQRFIFLSFFLLLGNGVILSQEWEGRVDLPSNFPIPNQTEKSLFFIQRNKNIRTIVYDLNLLKDGQLNRKDPLDFYWRERDGHRSELSWLEGWLAYGYRAKKKKDHTFQVKLRAHNERYIMLKQESNQWRAIISINGEDSYLTNIYAYADESGIFPDVIHVDIFGVNVKTGMKVKERIYD